jgi:hypothetical protein
MKKIISTLFLFALAITGTAQTSDTSDTDTQIEFTAYVPDQVEGITPIAKKNLENKLSQIILANGAGVSSANSRFIVTANVVVLSKDITPTAPPMQAYTLGITLYIGDGMEGTKFSSCSITVKGVGENETKAYLSALKNMRTNDTQYQSFIDKGKAKIVEYYNRKCDLIIKEATTMASQNQFDSALFKLSTIPGECKACYDKSESIAKTIYKQFIDNDCKIRLAEAKNSWNSNQNTAGATAAGEYLIQINPNASCYNEAQAFSDKIADKILADEKREWDFKLKVYQDNVSAEKAALDAEREIAQAYAKSLSTMVYNVNGWW